jgi:hypothetical protein
MWNTKLVAELNAEFLQLCFVWRWNTVTIVTAVTLFNFTDKSIIYE